MYIQGHEAIVVRDIVCYAISDSTLSATCALGGWGIRPRERLTASRGCPLIHRGRGRHGGCGPTEYRLNENLDTHKIVLLGSEECQVLRPGLR